VSAIPPYHLRVFEVPTPMPGRWEFIGKPQPPLRRRWPCAASTRFPAAGPMRGRGAWSGVRSPSRLVSGKPWGPPSGPCAAAVFTPSILAASASREHCDGPLPCRRERVACFPQGGRTTCFRSVRPGAIAAQILLSQRNACGGNCYPVKSRRRDRIHRRKLKETDPARCRAMTQ
jgi:hypothetical protein